MNLNGQNLTDNASRIMKLRQRFISILLVSAFAFVWGASNIAYSSQETQPLKFELALCGIGPFYSGQTYRVSDGTTLSTELTTYKTLKLMRKALEKHKKAIQRTIQQEDILDQEGKKIGERIIAITASEEGKEKTMMLNLENRSIYIITAASLHHVEEFQKKRD